MTENEVTIYSLRSALLSIPRSYGEGTMLLPGEAQYLATELLKTYFMVELDTIQRPVVDKTTRVAPINRTYEINSPLVPEEDLEFLHHNIRAAIGDLLTVVELKTVDAERTAQREKDEQLAFTLMKAANPANLRYAHWRSVPREAQTEWLAVAEKAREELK